MPLERGFFMRSHQSVASDLLSCRLMGKTGSIVHAYRITEVEIYGGEEDAASHARFGKTDRNSVMYESGGLAYIYLIYGMHWMLNIVTGHKNQPQAILIRGLEGISGPGRVTRRLGIDNSLNREPLFESNRLWLEKEAGFTSYYAVPRMGIDYAAEPWLSKPWRFIAR